MRESIIFDVQVLGISGNRWEPGELKTRLRAIQNTVDQYNTAVAGEAGGTWRELPNCIVRVTDTTGHIVECHLMENKQSGKLMFNTSETPLTKEDPHELEAGKLVTDALFDLDEAPSYFGQEEMEEAFIKLANRVRFYNEHFAVSELHPTPHYFPRAIVTIQLVQKRAGKFSLLQDQTGRLKINYEPGEEVSLQKEVGAIFGDLVISKF